MSTWLGDQGQRRGPIRPRLRIYVLWGQSHIQGTKSHASGVPDVPWPRFGAPVPGALIWDKLGRLNRANLDLVDTEQAGEAHRFRPLGAGFGAGGPNYPWVDPGPDPSFGPELVLAHNLRMWSGESVAIVKFAVSGSQVADLDDVPNWNVAALGRGDFSHLQVLLEAYLAPARSAAARDFPPAGLPVAWGGVISMIGTSDARHEQDAVAYGQNLTGIIQHVRHWMHPAHPERVPWLVLQSPRYVDPDGLELAHIRTVRTAQAKVANALPGVDVADCVDSRLGGTHFEPRGTAALGALMARWALRTPPLDWVPAAV
ncbi:MAG: sialate O-acetylesterase [Planctomycetota bacterium]